MKSFKYFLFILILFSLITIANADNSVYTIRYNIRLGMSLGQVISSEEAVKSSMLRNINIDKNGYHLIYYDSIVNGTIKYDLNNQFGLMLATYTIKMNNKMSFEKEYNKIKRILSKKYYLMEYKGNSYIFNPKMVNYKYYGIFTSFSNKGIYYIVIMYKPNLKNPPTYTITSYKELNFYDMF